jgi:hypothetical protein
VHGVGLLLLIPVQCLKILGLVEISKAKRENLFIIVVTRVAVIFLLFSHPPALARRTHGPTALNRRAHLPRSEKQEGFVLYNRSQPKNLL